MNQSAAISSKKPSTAIRCPCKAAPPPAMLSFKEATQFKSMPFFTLSLLNVGRRFNAAKEEKKPADGSPEIETKEKENVNDELATSGVTEEDVKKAISLIKFLDSVIYNTKYVISTSLLRGGFRLLVEMLCFLVIYTTSTVLDLDTLLYYLEKLNEIGSY